MSDFEKGRQRRYYSLNKDRKDGPMLGRRRPIILAKPERDRDRDGDKDRDGASKPSTSAGKSTTQPTIILRTREGENRAVSPSQRANTVLRKDGDTQQTPLYQLAAKPSSGENANPLAPPPEMKSAIKLIDESFQFCDGCLEYLLDQNDFTVVGCLGLQGTGKSTIMSLLAGCDVSGKTGFCFKPQGLEHHELGGHCTSGIDIYVTGNRVIMLDTQPMLSASVMDRLVQQEGKKFVGTEFASSTENAMEIQSLQLAAFLLSVCHIVILVQDWFFDPNILRFLQSAEMLKPSTPTTSQDEELIEYFPHVMFLHNKASTSEFGPLHVKLMQNVYNKTFLRSRLQIQSGMGIATGSSINCLTPEICGEPINLFLLPNMDDKEGDRYYRGHPGFTTLISKLRNQILGVTLQPITHTVLSEKNWFHYASKVWDGIKKSNFFMEYSRLLP